MRIISLFLLMLFLAFAALSDCQNSPVNRIFAGFSEPRSSGSVHGERSPSSIYQDMLLRYIYTHSFLDSSGALRRALTFSWNDQNSNSSTCCTTSWLHSTNNTNYPNSYIFCDKTSSPETWQWYFSSYISEGIFTLQLAHTFQDPAQFPPPYDTPTFFSTVAVKLKCSHKHGFEGCSLPRDGKVVHAVINGISD